MVFQGFFRVQSWAPPASECLKLEGYTTSLGWEHGSSSEHMVCINSYTSADCSHSQKPQPLMLPALWTDVAEAGAPDPATRDELNFTKGQSSTGITYQILAYLMQLDVGTHVLGLEGDCKLSDTPQSSRRSCSPSNNEPWTFSSQVPASNDQIPEEQNYFFSSPLPTIPFFSPIPRDPAKRLTCGRKCRGSTESEAVQWMLQLVGQGFSVPRPCNSWWTAALFHYLLNPTQDHHLVNTFTKKASLLFYPSTKNLFRNINI